LTTSGMPPHFDWVLLRMGGLGTGTYVTCHISGFLFCLLFCVLRHAPRSHFWPIARSIHQNASFWLYLWAPI